MCVVCVCCIACVTKFKVLQVNLWLAMSGCEGQTSASSDRISGQLCTRGLTGL